MSDSASGFLSGLCTQRFSQADGQFPHLILAVLGLGFLSALGLAAIFLASRYLPFVIFGLLSYLEPVLLAFASMALGGTGGIWRMADLYPDLVAVMVLIVEGILHLKQQQLKKMNLKKKLKNWKNSKKIMNNAICISVIFVR